MDPNGCTALVTGASGGIGQAIARALAQAGARVIVSGRREAELRKLAGDIGARVVIADLVKREDVGRLAGQAGDVDIFVGNAALPASGPLLYFTEEEIDRALDVNLRAPLVLARHFARGMSERRRGHIVFISSLAGKAASPGSALYSATKFGLRGLTFGLREDLREVGVGVSVICPGFIREAGMFADAGVALPSGMGTRSPEDVARAVLRAVEGNVAEIVVASVEQRAGAFFSTLSPELAGRLQAALGAGEVSRKVSAGQANKR